MRHVTEHNSLETMTGHTALPRIGARQAGFGPCAASWCAPAGARGERVRPLAIRIEGAGRGTLAGFSSTRSGNDVMRQETKLDTRGTLVAGYRQPRVKRNGAGAGGGGRTP